MSAFVVGSVAIISSPFSLQPVPFIRDVFSYLLAASALFYIYLSAEIYLWQAVGFIVFYVFFVGLVFWMDLGARGGRHEEAAAAEMEMGLAGKEIQKKGLSLPEWEPHEGVGDEKDCKSGSNLCGVLRKVVHVWEVPAATILKLTIPSTTPKHWSRFYSAANVALCPMVLVYSFRSFITLDTQIIFLLPDTQFPLWSVVLLLSLSFAVAYFFLEQEPPETEQLATILIAFVMSVFWISTMAGELLNCLAAIGTIMELPPAILGLTVLAWGNSVGDLVADVAVAKAGQPALAMAGCFVGPMFNMMIGLGTALVIETTNVYPGAYELRFHVSIVVAFVFLLVSLMGSLLVVTWCRFRVPRFWGFCLVGLYLVFTAVSLAIARYSG